MGRVGASFTPYKKVGQKQIQPYRRGGGRKRVWGSFNMGV